jgi:hypothetical protein
MGLHLVGVKLKTGANPKIVYYNAKGSPAGLEQ